MESKTPQSDRNPPSSPSTSPSSRSKQPEQESPLSFKVLSLLQMISFPGYNENLGNYNPLYLIYQLCVFRHELLRSTWELRVFPNPPPSLHIGMLNRISSCADELVVLRQNIDGVHDTRIATFSSGSASVYDTMLMFQLFETKLLELLVFLSACGLFEVPDPVWPELAAFVYRCRAKGLDLALLGHDLAAGLVEPELVSFLVMLDRFIAAVITPNSNIVPEAPLSIEEGLINLSSALEDKASSCTIQLLEDDKIVRLIPDVGSTLCGVHLSRLLRMLGTLSGSQMFGVLPLKGFTRSPKDCTLHILFELPADAHEYTATTLADALDGLQKTEILDLAIKISRLVYVWDAINLPFGPLFLEDILILRHGDQMKIYLRNFNSFCGCKGMDCQMRQPGTTTAPEDGEARVRLRELHEQQIESLGFVLLQILERRNLAGVPPEELRDVLSSILRHSWDYYALAMINAISGRASERWADRNANAQDMLPSNGFGHRVIFPLLSQKTEMGPLPPNDKAFLEVTVRSLSHALYIQPYGIFGSFHPSLKVRKEFQLFDFRREETTKAEQVVSHGSEVSTEQQSIRALEGKLLAASLQWGPRTSSLPTAQPSTNEQLKSLIFPVYADRVVLDCWHERLLPTLEKIISRLPQTHKPSSLAIDLLGIGATRETSQPTIVVTCGKIPSASIKSFGEYLKRKLPYDDKVFDLKVRKGMVKRCSAQPVRRGFNLKSFKKLNLEYQKKPSAGASIGAVRDGIPLPAGSFGGVVQVDKKVYGMTVHHLLDPFTKEQLEKLLAQMDAEEQSETDGDEDYDNDDEDDDDGEEGEEEEGEGEDGDDRVCESGTESSVQPHHEDLSSKGYVSESLAADVHSEQAEEHETEPNQSPSSPFYDDLSDVSSVISTSSILSDPGDIPGLPPSHNVNISISQPCIHDSKESAHLGTVAASSGLRRTRFLNCIHELDWALIDIHPSRLHSFNVVRGGGRFVSSLAPVNECDEDVLPIEILKTEDLGDKSVHSNGRTTGLQVGVIIPAMSSLVLPERSSAARCWCVLGQVGDDGDSGTWVIDNLRGAVAGVVIASCETDSSYRLAYLTPMEVIIEDVKAVMGAQYVRLPPISNMERVDSELAEEMGIISLDIEGGSDERSVMGSQSYGGTERNSCEMAGGKARGHAEKDMRLPGASNKMDIITWSMAVTGGEMDVEVRDDMVCV